MTKQGFKKILLRVLAVIAIFMILQLIHSFTDPVLNGVFSIKKMGKGGKATITKITLYENGNEVKNVLGDDRSVVDKIENLKLRNHLFDYSKNETQNYIKIEYQTTDKNGEFGFSGTLYIYDNGYYRDVVAEPFPAWKRDAGLYSFVKETLD